MASTATSPSPRDGSTPSARPCCSTFSGLTRSILLITHRYRLDRIVDAYETYSHAADTRALEVIIEA